MRQLSSIKSTGGWIVLGVLLVCGAAWSGWAQVSVATPGILVGEWQLLTAKSDFGGGAKLMAMESKVTRDAPDGIVYTLSVTYENGFHADYSFKGAADGVEHPISGGATLFTYTEEPGVVHETQRDPDGTLTKGDFTLSAKGKLGTWKYTVTNPDGSVIHQRLVFARTS